MAYSYYDADSVRYEEIVTQLIYTADSLYRIPIAAIDSVSFVEPVNEYQPNVVKIDALIPYVESVDGLKLCLSSDVPSDLLPRKGDVIIYESFENEFFPTGYAGKVQEVQPSSILCDSVNIGDIYKNYVSFGCFLAVADDDGTDEVPNTRLVPRIGGTVSPHFFAERTFPLNYDYLTGSITLRSEFNLRVIFKYEHGKPFFFDLSFAPGFKVGFKAGFEASGGITVKPKKVTLISAPINTFFNLKINVGPVLKFGSESSVTIGTDFTRAFRAGIKYKNGVWNKYGENKSKLFSEPSLSGIYSGSWFLGLEGEIGIFSKFDILSATLSLDVGAEFRGEFKGNMFNSNAYGSVKDFKYELNGKTIVSANVGIALPFDGNPSDVSIRKSLELLSWGVNLNNWFIVPAFSLIFLVFKKSL